MHTIPYNNREQWLATAMNRLSELYFTKPAHKLPPRISVSCGIPAGSLKAIGECWCPSVSKDRTTHIFLCPTQDDPVEVLHILLHELCHAVVGVKEKHGPVFGRLARAMRLEGPLTSTVPSDSLRAELVELAEELGPYPHKAITKTKPKKPSTKTKPKKPSTTPKKIKLVSESLPDYAVWIPEDVLNNHGPPTDPSGQPLKTKEQLEDE